MECSVDWGGGTGEEVGGKGGGESLPLWVKE